MSEMTVGIDFGTTNSALAVAIDGADPQLVGPLRSALHYHDERREPTGRLVPRVGDDALDACLEACGEGRLIQSTKSFLASPLFVSTSIYGTVVSLQTLVGIILKELRRQAEERFGPLGTRAVLGRPVRFAGGGRSPDEDLALLRLGDAAREAGFREVSFEYEPMAAAWHYERKLAEDALVLIGDFGGGTSDFSLVRVGPGQLARRDRDRSILGTEGVAVAGDAFDGRIVRHLVSPELGRGGQFRSIFGRILPVPSFLYGHLERWNHISFLRSRETLRLLYDLRREAVDRARLDGLVHLVENDLGFELYRAIQSTKETLSMRSEASFVFRDGPIDIEERVTRTDFEAWIAPELATMSACVDDLLQGCGVRPDEVEHVFLTGGSSLVPAVRRIFEERFGAAQIDTGAEFTSIARGLALAR